jgi:pyruvate formate lyase activating enzyme
MEFGGFQKLDLVDYPGKVAAIVFTKGCNFHCPYCHNPDLVRGESERIAEDDVLRYLENRKTMLDGLVVSGGEPCIHAELPDFLKEVKDGGLLVKLDTNGSHPEMLATLLQKKLCDYVAMDIKTSKERYQEITGFPPEPTEESMELLRKSGIPYELRTTCVPTIVGEDELDEIGKWIKKPKRWVLQAFNPEKTLDPSLSTVKPYSLSWFTAMKEREKGAAENLSLR